MAGSSSSLPSSGEANPYPYPSHVCAPNFVTVKLSGLETYNVWKMQMWCLLESHDMLGFISSHASGEEKVGDDMLWRRSDALVKGWILGSLSQQTLEYFVKPIPDKDLAAKDVWDELHSLYGPPTQEYVAEEKLDLDLEIIMEHAKKEAKEATKEAKKEAKEAKEAKKEAEEAIKKVDAVEVKILEEEKKRSAEKLHAAILQQNFLYVEHILHDGVVTLRDEITINGNTALHVAVGTGKNIEFLEKMLNLASKDNQPSLDMRNLEGSTPLHVAAIIGNTEAAKMLVEKNPDLFYEKDNEGQTPLYRALSNMHTDTSIYLLDLYLKFPDMEKLDKFDSSEIVVNAISSKDYDSALKMAKYIRDPDTVLTAIAQNFPPKVNFLERRMMFLFSYVPVKIKFVEAIKRKAKAYNDAKFLARFACRLIRESTTTSTCYNNASFEATRQNAVKVVKIIVSKFPNAIWSINEDGHNIIQYAVINRSEKVYNLLYQMSEHKNIYRTIKDPYENNLLHLAARLAPENKLDPISGAALKIQRELQWFKEVESFVCPLNTIQKNSSGETPQMVFTNEHNNLLSEGEKWMKETAQSYTITATLITTIMFAAAITVPGGNKQDNGIPVFANISLFTLFAISDVISFFTSVASLLMFLSIVTDSFTEQNFLVRLPAKLIIGLVSLSISTIAMLVAFSTSFVLVFGQNSSRIFAPIVALIILPFTFFITLQFALVKKLISATYGRSMFGKKSNAPFY
ncbi:hypothetical protein E3N88_09604 [Mikania micrantha]|uniref:PGG domain-containing protein n=1 Tax=Mikania micrantha TaxID=192012 RepID=A0A5N6PKE5_9ASTR|nr:hypothetical protein E3N88_09604 [Mikania micrantha]